MSSIHSGVTFYEDDRDNGPFIIRIAGTREFVSSIRDGYYSRWGMPGKGVTLVEDREHQGILVYQTMDEAIAAAAQVWKIEGLHATVEAMIK